jgi:GNAT superfamily N-acetyltransferase
LVRPRPREWLDALVFCDEQGVLRGICCYFRRDFARMDGTSDQAGNVSLWVDPTCYRQGIGMKLLREADQLWKINFRQQRMTPAGAALVKAYFGE